MSRIYYLIVFYFFLGSQVLDAQSGTSQSISNDSILDMGYGELIKRINESQNPSVRLDYAQGYLRKAKKSNDSLNLLVGYEILAAINPGPIAIQYSDSIINKTKNNPDDFYPGNAYLNKAREYYALRKFRQALDNYLEAYNYARAHPNLQLLFESRYGIGILKSRIGGHQETISIQRENLEYFEDNPNLYNEEKYLNTLFSIATAYSKLEKLDSARYYNKKGLGMAIQSNDELLRNLFLINEGITKLQVGDYKDALRDVAIGTERVTELGDVPNIIVGNYYLGKLYLLLNETELGISHLKKVDSLFTITNDVHPEVRETYHLLTNHYKQINDKENQLKYLNSLILVDSVLNDYKVYLVDGINRNFETPELLASKQALINDLNQERVLLFVLLAVVIILLGVFINRYFRVQKDYKKRFELLMSNQEKEEIKQDLEKSEKIDLPVKIVEAVMHGLSRFEEQEGYKDSGITLSNLAKSINTNSNYLSKIVNYKKGKNFSTYLNELRIEYAINRLKADSVFRKFTINAIADEVGFKSAETFSRSFKSITGIYPSYFIRKLEESVDKNNSQLMN